MAAAPNPCSGRFGAIYDFYIERPRLARAVLGLMWGVDPRPFYASLAELAGLPAGQTILDVPCGGGLALRALPPNTRYIGVDIDRPMLDRARRRAAARGHGDIELVEADMQALPLESAIADLCLSYGGLHCVPDPAAALFEMARCLRPGGKLLGSTFVAPGSRRQSLLLRHDDFGRVGRADELRDWIAGAGLVDGALDRDDGLVVFRARRPR